jgi:hypothetical protein
MLRVGLVAEGRSDFLVLEQVMKKVQANIECVEVHPNHIPILGLGNGWKGVRGWCRRYGAQLELFMSGFADKPLHILVIHADCSMADKEGAEHPCPAASTTATALVEVITKTWLNRHPLPDFVVIATPSKSSDAWVIATFDPPYSNLVDLECDKGAEDEFVRRKLLKRKDGKPKKHIPTYRRLAERIDTGIDLVYAHCPQAEAFRTNFQAAVARTSPPSAP